MKCEQNSGRFGEKEKCILQSELQGSLPIQVFWGGALPRSDKNIRVNHFSKCTNPGLS